MNRRMIALLWVFLGTGGHADDRWVGTWATSVQEVERELVPEGFGELQGVTVRQVVRTSIGGKRIRVRFSNAFADWNDDLRIGAVTVALAGDGGGLRPETMRRLTFNGEPGVAVPFGVLTVSDPLDFELPAGGDLVISMHVEDGARKLSGHRSARGEYAVLQKGAHADAETLPDATPSSCWYHLAGVDVLVSDEAAAVVCLGDSITDGKGSTEGLNRRWPDLLAARLRANPGTARVGVLNQGIGGNALWRGGIGQTALNRFDRDVLAQPGARWLIVMEGVNDLGGGKTTSGEIIFALQQVIARARDRDLRVYGVTILPFGGSFYDKPGLEERRQEVNRWIRGSGAFDAVLDWDAVVRDPDRPEKLRLPADSGDHLHLSDEGYRMLAESVDLGLFQEAGP